MLMCLTKPCARVYRRPATWGLRNKTKTYCMKFLSSFDGRVLLAFGAAIVVAGGLTATTWKMAADAARASDLVAHAHAVTDQLSGIRSDTLQIELSTQSFRITGDAGHLVERDRAIAAREVLLSELKRNTTDSPSMQAEWETLNKVIGERLAVSRKIEQLRKTEGVAAANAYAATAPLNETRAKVYRTLEAMDAEMDQKLAEGLANQMSTQRTLVAEGVMVTVFLLMLLSATYLHMYRQTRATRASQKALAQSEESVRKLNEILERRVTERTTALRESEDHLRSVINNLPAAIAYVDADQRYVYANAKYLERFASGREGIAGLSVREVIGEPLYAIASNRIAKALSGRASNYDWEQAPGTWQLVSYIPKHNAAGRVLGYYVLISDITDRKRNEEAINALNAELEQHVLVLERTGRALKTLSAGNRSMLGASGEQDLLDSMCRAIVGAGDYPAVAVWYKNDDESKSLTPMAGEGHPEGLAVLNQLKVTWADNDKGQGAVANAIRTGEIQSVANLQSDPNYAQWREQLRDLNSVVACPVKVDRQVIGVLAIYGAGPDAFSASEKELLAELADDLGFGISTMRTRLAQQKTEEAIHQLTLFDALTGLPNEAQFSEFLASAISEGTHLHHSFAVMQINIDRLNEINDALGFSQGDQLLRAFSTRLVTNLPDQALTARLRGDQFAILLPGSNEAAAIAMAKHVAALLAQPFTIADIPLDVSVSIGVALFPEHGATAHDLYRHVDSAVNQAKRKGLSHYVYNPARSNDQRRRLGLAGELRRAIENGDLQLYLQPKVEMASGKVFGAEGLVRWKHAERGLIPPGEFIDIAEHTGLIKPLTEWVIETGLRLNQTWQREGCALPIALNLSARNLHDDNLLEKIRQLRATWSGGAGFLELEVTESSVMEDAEFAIRVLHTLHDDGIPLYVDDYGTGYSSLAYLQRLPVDYVKIDQSFVRNMSESKDSALIVRSTIDLVHDMGRKTVAEGVETQEDWDLLAAMGCDFAQGYFIARPMPALDMPVWLAQYRPLRQRAPSLQN